MARGSVAKENIINKLAETFGENFIGEVDKKIYVWADDGGEKVQIAITLTCPKTMVEAAPPSGSNEVGSTPVTTSAASVEIGDEERANIQALMAKLGL